MDEITIAIIILSLIIILPAAVIWHNIGNKAKDYEPLPIKQQISIEPLKAATSLGYKLFTDEHTRNVFICSLVQYTHMCLIKETIRRCTDQEIRDTVINIHECIMKQAATTFHVRVNFYFDMPGFKEKLSESTCDEILMSVAESFMEFTTLPKQEYAELFAKYVMRDYPHLVGVNREFINYVKAHFSS